MLGEAIETELLRHVVSMKDDIAEIKIKVNNFEQKQIIFEDALKNMNQKITDLETNLQINTLGIEQIEKREVLFRRTKRFFRDSILVPLKSAGQKGVVTIVLMIVSIVITWFLTRLNIIPDAQKIFEYIK